MYGCVNRRSGIEKFALCGEIQEKRDRQTEKDICCKLKQHMIHKNIR